MLAEKPGNVSPRHSFTDATAEDFVTSGAAIAPVLATALQFPVGQTILHAVQATNAVVGHNTNLGIILLLAPLAAVPQDQSLRDGLQSVLQSLSVDDARSAFDAIRLASPGGLGKASDQDVSATPTMTLLDCMRLAADRDQIAAEYCSGFATVFETGLPLLQECLLWNHHADRRLGWLSLQLLARFGDSLIARKCGEQLNQQVQQQAQHVLDQGWPFESKADFAYLEFDRFLRDPDHRRNPGTTADLTAAVLFVAQRLEVCEINDDGSLSTAH